MSTIHPGISLRWALCIDSVSPRINTFASHDQFEPIRIGENFEDRLERMKKPESLSQLLKLCI